MKPEIVKQNLEGEYLTPEGCWIYETWNAESDPSVSVARARVMPGETTQLHGLVGIAERYRIVEGSGRMEVGGGSPTEVGSGDLVFIPPGVSQRITNCGDIDLVFYCICTPPFRQDAYLSLEGSGEQ